MSVNLWPCRQFFKYICYPGLMRPMFTSVLRRCVAATFWALRLFANVMEGDDGMRLLVVVSADTWCTIMAEFARGRVVERRWGYTWCNQLWQSLLEGWWWRGGGVTHGLISYGRVTHGVINYGRVWWREGCGEGVWGYTWWNQLWQSLMEGGVWRGIVELHMV